MKMKMKNVIDLFILNIYSKKKKNSLYLFLLRNNFLLLLHSNNVNDENKKL